MKSKAASVVRRRQVFNMDDAKTIGILYKFKDNEDFDLLKKYVLYLRELKKKVKVLVYYTTKEEPYTQYSKVDYDFFGKKSHGWDGTPSDHILKNFTDEEFDLLIDINDDEELVITHMSVFSRAAFKIGRWSEDDFYHDFLIDSPADKGLKYFLRQIDTYLQMINKDKKDIV